MIKDSAKKEWDYVLVYKLDRFSRNKYESVIHKKTLKDNGVKIISCMENIPDTPEGIILESLLEGMNQYYSAELAQKVRRGMHESRLKGNFTGGTLPYGYTLNGKKIIIDEDKSKIIQYMFKQYSIDVPVSKIITTLANHGVLYKNKPFKRTTVYKILRNERYIGKYVINGKEYPNMFPRIIDDKLFEKVHKKALSNHYGTKSVKSTYLFRNKLRCGYCGMPISAECAIIRNGSKISYYKCLGIKKYRNGCQKKTIRQEDLEKFLMDTIINELSKKDTMDLLINNLMEIQKNFSSNNVLLNSLIKNKKQAETTLNNIMFAIEQGIINKTTGSRMKELEQQIEDYEKQILIETTKKQVIISESEIRKYYQLALEKESLTLINYLIKEIVLYNDKIEITFNSPINKSPDNQGSYFLSKTRFMKKFVQHQLEPLMIKIQIDFYL